MNPKHTCSHVRTLAATLAMGLCMAQPAHSASVSGSYQGTIDSDSGLGLIGQTLRVDFTYDDAAVPDDGSVYNGPNLYAATFSSFLQSMTVRIGAHTWTWDNANGSDYLTLYDNSVIVYSIGTEDRLTLFGYEFTGPDIAGPGSYGYALEIYLSDNTPAVDPDALSGYTALPAVAPNPDRFNTPDWLNTMEFSFHIGDPETGPRFAITTANVTQAVPEPESFALMLAGVGLVGWATRRRKERRIV